MRDTSNRRDKISSLIKANGSVQVSKLVEQFDVSAVTIRKDLKFLEDLGLSTRTYGGAIRNEGSRRTIERPIECKEQLFAKEKYAIGKAAAELVKPGDAIILDSGTTTFHLAAQLHEIKDVIAVTNGLNVMNKLSSVEHLELIMLGGTLRRKNMSFFGAHAERALQDLHVDKLFLGVDGFHLEKGITTHFEPEAHLNRIMVSAANEIIVVTDSSKFGSTCLHQIVMTSQIATVVTDQGIPENYKSGLREMGITVLIADEDGN